MTAPESAPIAGSRVGRYVIIREVAQGTLGPLYIAEREVGDGVLHGLARVVPLPPGLPAKDEQALADAIWDSTNLNHELVLRVADVVTGKGWLTLIHEHSEGSLIEFLQRCSEELTSPFPAKVAARIALDVVEGLEQSRDHCAASGIPWRPGSVAPGSLLLGPDGRVRALDGQITSAALRVPALRAQPGATAFAAPEMLDDSKEPSERTDVFSIGVLLWELLTGRTLFGDKANALDLGRSFKVPKIAQSLPEGVKVPQGLVHAVHTALEAEPLKRQASLRELAVAIVMGVEEVATYEQVVAFTDKLLEPRPDVDLQPEAPPTDLLLRQHTPPTPAAAPGVADTEGLRQPVPPTPVAVSDMPNVHDADGSPQQAPPEPFKIPDAGGARRSTPPIVVAVPVASDQLAPAAFAPAVPPLEVPLLDKAPVAARTPIEQSRGPSSGIDVASEPSGALATPQREKLDTLPGQGSVRPGASSAEQQPALTQVAASVPSESGVISALPQEQAGPKPVEASLANRPSSPAASPQQPAEPFRLVSNEPFVPLAALPVQAIGDAPGPALVSGSGNARPSASSHSAPAQAWDEQKQTEPVQGLRKKHTLQLSMGTLILGFSTTVLAVIVIMLVMQRSQSSSGKAGPTPAKASVSESVPAAPGVTQAEVSNVENKAAGNVKQSDAGIAMPSGAKTDYHKRTAKDQAKSPGKSSSEDEPPSGDSKAAGQPPNQHYIPNEL